MDLDDLFPEVPPPPDPVTQPFGLEIPTKRKSPELSTYQALLSVFDEMTPEERIDFTELAFCFKNLSPKERKNVLEAVRNLTGAR